MISLYKKRKPASPCYARMRFGISQQQLADLLGVSRSLVTMMEQGKRKFPGDVNAIYLRLCSKADELPSDAEMKIKRGRKPMGSNSNLFFVPLVSNYRMENFDTIKHRNRRRKWVTSEIGSMPSLETMADKVKKDKHCDAITGKLKEQKNRLLHIYAFLEFKKERRELRHIELSAKLEGMNKALAFIKPLEETLPDGRQKRKMEMLNVCYSYKQLLLSKEVKKWDAVSLIKIEWQMNCIEQLIGLTDKWIGALSSEAVLYSMKESYGSGISSLAV